jgi:tetratricopeptide (TPR) repeat protein
MLSKIKKTLWLFLVFYLVGFLQVASARAETQEQLYHSAERLMEDGFYDEAKGQFEKVASLDSGNALGISARLKISDVYFKQNRFEAALQIAEKVVAEKPENYDAQFHLACAFAKMKRYEETAQAFAKTVELRPEEGLGLVGQGLAVFGKGEVAPAVQIILQAKDVFKKKRNIPWHRNVRIMVNQMKNFEKYPQKFANLWLENNFKMVYETYAEFIFQPPIEK